ncbi:MAG: site-2 protease family protein [Anaerolineae bacterium]
MNYFDEETLYPVERKQKSPIQISPVFGAMVGVTAIAGYLNYLGGIPMPFRTLVFMLFVIGGWLISLSLHEFGHALVAYWGGDKSVVHKGYLTLDPFKYTHATYSIVLPLLYLAMGGIGLPGGAVYINMDAIKSKAKRSLTSAAGPAATALCALALLSPFILRVSRIEMYRHSDFWAGIALLAFLQLTGLLFNLLPIPGLDGWGILETVLPESTVYSARLMGRFSLLIILVIFMGNNPVSRGFWQWVMFAGSKFGLNFALVGEGLRLFQFWRP